MKKIDVRFLQWFCWRLNSSGMSKSWNAEPCGKGNYIPSKCHELHSQWHSVTSHNKLIFKIKTINCLEMKQICFHNHVTLFVYHMGCQQMFTVTQLCSTSKNHSKFNTNSTTIFLSWWI